jgi:hypothetical protein
MGWHGVGRVKTVWGGLGLGVLGWVKVGWDGIAWVWLGMWVGPGGVCELGWDGTKGGGAWWGGMCWGRMG